MITVSKMVGESTMNDLRKMPGFLSLKNNFSLKSNFS